MARRKKLSEAEQKARDAEYARLRAEREAEFARWAEMLERAEAPLVVVPEVPNGVKFALHLAISATADVSVIDTLIELAIDRRNAGYRRFFIDALAHMPDIRARAVLQELQDEPDLAEVFMRLKKRLKKQGTTL